MDHLTRRRFLEISTAAAAAILTSGAASRPPSPPVKKYSIIGFAKPFQGVSFEAAADIVAEVGWDGMECLVRRKGQIEPERVADELPGLVEALAHRGKGIGVMSTDITSLADPHAESVLRTAAKVGIKRYRLGFRRYEGNRSIPAQVADQAAALRDVAALNRELGLQAGWENHSGHAYIGAPVWDLWLMMKDLDPAEMGVCFDIGHATVEGGMSWPLQARLMEHRLTAVYVKDFVWRRTGTEWRPEWVMLGQGMVDRGFFDWLLTTPFDGPISQFHEYDVGEGRPMIAKMKQDLHVLRGWLASTVHAGAGAGA